MISCSHWGMFRWDVASENNSISPVLDQVLELDKNYILIHKTAGWSWYKLEGEDAS